MNIKKICSGIILLVCIIVVLCLLIPFNNVVAAFADPNSSLEKELLDITNEFDKASKDYGDALLAKQEAEKEIDNINKEINEIEADIERNKNELYKTCKFMYINSPTNAYIEMLLNAVNASDLLKTFEAIEVLNKHINAVLFKENDLRASLKNNKNKLDENYTIISKKEEDAKNIKENTQKRLKEVQEKLYNYNTDNLELVTYKEEWNSDVAKRACEEQSKPYIFGAVGPEGYDCSGLVSYCLTGEHIRIGTTTTFMSWNRIDGEPKPGDICTSETHCGIYIGEGKIIHSPRPGDFVRVGKVQSDMIFVHP